MKSPSAAVFMLIFTSVSALAGCIPVTQAQNEPARAGETPANEAFDSDATAVSVDAADYAKQFGVEPEEAVRRLELQGTIGELSAVLQQKESATFAGLWIQHEPDYRVVVAFTKDSEETIRPYLEGKPWAALVEVRTSPYSLAELEAAQRKAVATAQELGLSVGGWISVPENRVVLQAGNPELFLEEIRAAGLELPEPVEVVAIDSDHLSDTLRGGVDLYAGPGGRTIYFPMQPPANAYLEALMEGTLALDPNGCLRVESQGSDAPLILWHYDFTLRMQGETIEVLDGEALVVARVGESVRMGGGFIPLAGGTPGMPIDACPGPYWLLGQIEPAA